VVCEPRVHSGLPRNLVSPKALPSVPNVDWDGAIEMCKEAILEVLDRAAVDLGFVAQMTSDGADAFKDCPLDQAERAALLNRDTRWPEAHSGSLAGRIGGWTRGYPRPHTG
jgi:hypothetical protein